MVRYYLDVLLEGLLERPLAQRALYFAATVLALAALDYVIVYRHLAGGIVRATEELELARLDEARLRADLGRLPQLRGELAGLGRELHSRLPRRGTSTPLEDVSAQAAMAGLEVIRFHPGAARHGEQFTEIPTKVELKGAFHDLLRFLERAAGARALPNPTHLTLDAVAVEDGLAVLRIALELTALRVRSSEPFDEDTQEPVPYRTAAGVDAGPLSRDPFQPYQAQAPPEPEGHPVPDPGRDHPYVPRRPPPFRAVGIVWQQRTAVALVRDAEDFGHVVQPGARLGRDRYRIKAITPCEIVMETTGDDPAAHETRLRLPRCGAFEGAAHPRPEPAPPRP